MPYYHLMMLWYPFMKTGIGLFWLTITIALAAYFGYKLTKSEKISESNKPVVKAGTDTQKVSRCRE